MGSPGKSAPKPQQQMTNKDPGDSKTPILVVFHLAPNLTQVKDGTKDGKAQSAAL